MTDLEKELYEQKIKIELLNERVENTKEDVSDLQSDRKKVAWTISSIIISAATYLGIENIGRFFSE